MSNGKAMTIHLIAGFIERTSLYRMTCYPEL